MNLNDLNQDRIFELSSKIPEIKAAITLWQQGQITWEQATYIMIISISESREELMQSHISLLQKFTPVMTGYYPVKQSEND